VGVGAGLQQALPSQKIQDGPSQPPIFFLPFFTKTHHFRGRLCGKASRTIIAGAEQIDGTWKHLKKWRPISMLHKKNQQVCKKKYSWAYSWTWRHHVALSD
jgi:hypothetical protein